MPSDKHRTHICLLLDVHVCGYACMYIYETLVRSVYAFSIENDV